MSDKRVEGSKIGNRFNWFLWKHDISGKVASRDKYLSSRSNAEGAEKYAKHLYKTEFPLESAKRYEEAAKYWLSAKEGKRAIANYNTAEKIYTKLARKEDTEGDSDYARRLHKKALRDMSRANRIDRAIHGEYHGLEGKTAAAAAIIGVIGGLFFLSPIVTGNAIGNMTNSTTNLIGESLFLIGLIGAFFYFRRR